jgi:hypothetical protein
MPFKDTARRAYANHKSNAKQRGIPFLLTFEQWLAIWIASGRLDERGHFKGQYVMARFKDRGAYETGNVRIITVSENGTEKKVDAKGCARMSAAQKGHTRFLFSPESRAKLSASLRRWHQQHPNSFSEERRAMLRDTLAKTRARMRHDRTTK